MHKGYTTSYFIDFFSSIPNKEWTEGTEDNEQGQFCALGHTSRDMRTGDFNQNTQKRYALANLFESADTSSDMPGEELVAEINDADYGSRFYSLGKTPRTRIVKALRNLRRTGDVLGNKN